MSLIKGRTMTEQNRAAHQRNGRKSRGPATPEGKERSRAASLRHGFYSAERDEALTALGEDPAQLNALLGATREHWRPADDFEARMSDRLARLLWRMERAERIQESLVANLALEHEKRRRGVAQQLRQRFNPHFRVLGDLVESAADPRFYTTSSHFRRYCEAFGNPPNNALEAEFLLVLHRLRRPPAPADGPANQETPPLDKDGGTKGGVVVPNPAPLEPPPAPSAQPPLDDLYLRTQAELDSDDFPVPWPDEEVAEGPERDALREELRIRAKSLLAIEHLARDPSIAEFEAPLTHLQRDPVLATPNHDMELMRREEERCFRQFARLGNFMVKIQTHAEKHAENEGASGYVDENTQAEPTAPDGMPESEVRGPESEVKSATPETANTGSGVRGPEFGVQAETRSSKLETPTIDIGQSKIDHGQSRIDDGWAESA